MPTLVSLAGGSPFTGMPQEPCRVINCTPSTSSDILCLCVPAWGSCLGNLRLVSRDTRLKAGGGSSPGSGQGSFSAGLPVHIGMKVALLHVAQSYTLESQHQGSFHCPSMARSMFYFFPHSPRGSKAILPSQQGQKNVGQMALSAARVRQLDVSSGVARCLQCSWRRWGLS